MQKLIPRPLLEAKTRHYQAMLPLLVYRLIPRPIHLHFLSCTAANDAGNDQDVVYVLLLSN